MGERFRKACSKISEIVGYPSSLIVASSLIFVWAATGPYFDWSDSHALILNDITTAATFLLLFLLQNSQNRFSKEVQLKLEELIRASEARNKFIDLHLLSDKELKELQADIKKCVKEYENKNEI